MRWILYASISIVAVVAIIVVVGAMLPKSHTATRQARFRQSPEALFAVVSGMPDWRPSIKKYEALPPVDGRQRWRETTSWGDAVLYELMESTPPFRRRTRIADPSLPYGGTWTFHLSPEGDSTMLRITEDGEVRNVVFRFLSRFVFGHTGNIEGYLRELGAKVGETVAIER